MLKQLPSNIEAEQSLLGSMIIDREIVELFINEFDIEIFYERKHYKIIEAIFELYNDGESVDIITVHGKGIDLNYIIELTQIVPTSANWYSYAKIVENEYKNREVILKARKLEQLAYNKELILDNSVEEIFTDINSILLTGSSDNSKIADNAVKSLEDFIEINSKKGLIGYSWGNNWLNEYTNGIQKGKTYRIGAPGGTGKSNVVYSTIVPLLEQGAKVLFFTLENNFKDTYIKIFSQYFKENPNSIKEGKTKVDLSIINKYKDQLFIVDKLSDLSDIKRETLKIKPDVVFLDYVQLVQIKGIKNSLEKLDRYSLEVKNFVQGNQTFAWIDLAQLLKDSKEEDTVATGEFKGSGELRNSVDFTCHIFKNKDFSSFKELSIGTPSEQEYKNISAVNFHITKNRDGTDFGKKVFWIKFNEGIKYEEVPYNILQKWF